MIVGSIYCLMHNIGVYMSMSFARCYHTAAVAAATVYDGAKCIVLVGGHVMHFVILYMNPSYHLWSVLTLMIDLLEYAPLRFLLLKFGQPPE